MRIWASDGTERGERRDLFAEASLNFKGRVYLQVGDACVALTKAQARKLAAEILRLAK